MFIFVLNYTVWKIHAIVDNIWAGWELQSN